ncbi:MAG: MTH1187 family thiamine-binding protein [Methanomassiliicoccales archaeon]
MIAQFKVIPVGKGESLSSYVAECVRIVKESGLKYQLTPMATIIEGEWDEVMEVIGKCHHKVRSMCNRVVTSIEVDDRGGHKDAMEQKVRSVQDKLSRAHPSM